MPEGRHFVSARYAASLNAPEIQSPRDVASGLWVLVNTSLPYDPLSVCLVDSMGQSIVLPTLGYSFGANQTGSFLRAGQTYTMNVQAKGGKPNISFKATFVDILITSLTDPDGNGNYQGLVTLPAPGLQRAMANPTQVAAPQTLGLLADDGSTESRFSNLVNTANAGVISDRNTGNPLSNASVAALIAQTNASGESFFSAWLSGQSNPQVTGADGRYSVLADSGNFRLDVTRAGYQPYRSDNIDAGVESLSKNIALTPVINEAATQKIYITASGFQPAVTKVNAGAVVEFINLDLVDHAATGSAFDSGVLAPGASYKVKLGTSSSYSDGTGSSSTASIVIDGGRSVFMPMLAR